MVGPCDLHNLLIIKFPYLKLLFFLLGKHFYSEFSLPPSPDLPGASNSQLKKYWSCFYYDSSRQYQEKRLKFIIHVTLENSKVPRIFIYFFLNFKIVCEKTWWNKIYILRQDKKKLNIKFSLCVCLDLIPASLMCSVHPHYTLTRAPQRWECLLNHKDQIFFFLLTLAV